MEPLLPKRIQKKYVFLVSTFALFASIFGIAAVADSYWYHVKYTTTYGPYLAYHEVHFGLFGACGEDGGANMLPSRFCQSFEPKEGKSSSSRLSDKCQSSSLRSQLLSARAFLIAGIILKVVGGSLRLLAPERRRIMFILLSTALIFDLIGVALGCDFYLNRYCDICEELRQITYTLTPPQVFHTCSSLIAHDVVFIILSILLGSASLISLIVEKVNATRAQKEEHADIVALSDDIDRRAKEMSPANAAVPTAQAIAPQPTSTRRSATIGSLGVTLNSELVVTGALRPVTGLDGITSRCTITGVGFVDTPSLQALGDVLKKSYVGDSVEVKYRTPHDSKINTARVVLIEPHTTTAPPTPPAQPAVPVEQAPSQPLNTDIVIAVRSGRSPAAISAAEDHLAMSCAAIDRNSTLQEFNQVEEYVATLEAEGNPLAQGLRADLIRLREAHADIEAAESRAQVKIADFATKEATLRPGVDTDLLREAHVAYLDRARREKAASNESRHRVAQTLEATAPRSQRILRKLDEATLAAPKDALHPMREAAAASPVEASPRRVGTVGTLGVALSDHLVVTGLMRPESELGGLTERCVVQGVGYIETPTLVALSAELKKSFAGDAVEIQYKKPNDNTVHNTSILLMKK